MSEISLDKEVFMPTSLEPILNQENPDIKFFMSYLAKSVFFEYNSFETRAKFEKEANYLMNFLCKIRKSIYDFKVVCDESNNPPELIDAYKFVADIFFHEKKDNPERHFTMTLSPTNNNIGFTDIEKNEAYWKF
jgi:hypothetical protein